MNKKRYILVVGIILIGVISLVLLNSKLDNKETKLDEVKLKENKVDKNSFAIMIQKEDGTGYEASTSNTWPTNMIYNSKLSGCIDNYGSIIEDSLTYDNTTNKVTIKTGVTSSCYLYFDLDSEAPIVSATVNNNNSTNATITITSNETGTYCVNTSATSTANCTFSGNITKDVSVTTAVFTTGGDYYVHVKDSAGNIGISSKVTVTLITYAGEELLSISSAGLNTTTAYDGMYRYIGTTVNNYVKLDNVLYRIIGITTTTDNNTKLGIEANQLKVIKAESIGTHAWHSPTSSNATWISSTMHNYLNDLDDDTTNQVLNNTSIIPSKWNSKIDLVKWHIGDVQTYTNASTIYGLESNIITSSTSKIGLIYLSDYYYAFNAGGTQNCGSIVCRSWMTSTSGYMWTMTRYGYNSGWYSYAAWIVRQDGGVGSTYNDRAYAMQPTFYLDKDVYITNPGAKGTSTDPFILGY